LSGDINVFVADITLSIRLGSILLGSMNSITISATTYDKVICGGSVFQFAPGDVIDCQIYQNSGSTGALVTSVNSYFCIFKID
jgi:hypothetical protein